MCRSLGFFCLHLRFFNYTHPIPCKSRLPQSIPLRILVAEDNRVNQTVVRRLVEKQGHTVVIASDGREAVKAFEEGMFDLILMDVQMPELDGLEATEAIRKLEAGRNRTPIICSDGTRYGVGSGTLPRGRHGRFCLQTNPNR
jgi:PleD family two-component response regulator